MSSTYYITVTFSLILSMTSISAKNQVNSGREKNDGHDFGIIKTDASPYAKLKSVDLQSVQWNNGFWGDQFSKAKEVSLPRLWDLAGPWAWHNMRAAAGLEAGEARGVTWQDEWIYKWIESACYLYTQTHDKKLLDKIDTIVTVIAKAQSPDGYIATQVTLRKQERFQVNNRHEMYVMGHLITAACVHYRITGKDNFMQLARKTADFLYKEYKYSTNPYLINCPYNPSIIMAAVELYRTTGEKNYLELANIVIDNRGKARKDVPVASNGQKMGNTDLNQDRIPLRDEKEVVGHAVFWSYLYAGAADAYMETGDKTLMTSLERLWTDLVNHKMYITGGVSPLHTGLSSRFNEKAGFRQYSYDEVHEAAGLPYELPNSTAYNETCGQIGNLMWNWRMLSITGEARFADIMEQTIFNSVLSGVNVSGEGWSYTNPLSWHGKDQELLSNDFHTRVDPGAKQICCPTNVMRTVASWHGYLYSTESEKLWIHHYGANESTIDIPGVGQIKFAEETSYPWDGNIRLIIKEVTASKPFAIRMRIPGWAENATIKVNQQNNDQSFKPSSYAEISQKWKKGDVIELNLPMTTRLMTANSLIEHDCNQTAVMRGPVVYCLESTDLPKDISIDQIHIIRDSKWNVENLPNLLGGVNVLKTKAVVAPKMTNTAFGLYQPLSKTKTNNLEIKLIPYYAWNNRGEPEMKTWIPFW